MKTKNYDVVYTATMALEKAKHDYLHGSGWVYTSITPDYCWRWEKTIDGKCYCTNVDDAVGIQNSLDNR